MPIWFDENDYETVAAACERLIPRDEASGAPGATAAEVARYVDQLLGAFTFDPPRIWAGGPFSGRHGGDAGFENWIRLRPLDERAWRTRIEGSRGDPERERNGPVIGLQERYRSGLVALGRDFVSVDGTEQDRRLDAVAELKAMLYEHACEGMYGDPVYGGNAGGCGWAFIQFDGDMQPRGYTDAEVEEAGGAS
ncbi:MAG: gluconate 2-dehydrogenase subunit 3 family protein [Actinobacteria bacterium]|nr:gluconate 2-dehydrogenase subunit 3 family protein [Actinomycetota bacterium]